jgi:hypothetical protein
MIRKKQESREIVIDLTEPEGNVFVLFKYAQKFSRMIAELYEEDVTWNREMNRMFDELDCPKGERLPERLGDMIVTEMMKSDYENAIQVFDRYFGSFVVLER